MSGLDKFEAMSRRGPRRGVPEQLLCQKLVAANRTNDILKRVRILCEAAWLAKKKYENFTVDMSLVERLHSVAVALNGVQAEKVRVDNLNYLIRYPIQWSFEMTTKNFDAHIRPWLKTFPEYFTRYVPTTETFKVYKTRVLCPYCHTVLLELPRKDRENHKDRIRKKFKGQIKNETQMFVSQTTYKMIKRVIEKRQNPHFPSVHAHFPRTYEPPRLWTQILECPKCQKPILLERERFEGSHPYLDRMNLSVKVQVRDYASLWLEDHIFFKEELIGPCFSEMSPWLTKRGYQTLANSFKAYANPLVTEIEAEISALISPKVWEKWGPRSEEEEEGEEKSRGNKMEQRE